MTDAELMARVGSKFPSIHFEVIDSLVQKTSRDLSAFSDSIYIDNYDLMQIQKLFDFEFSAMQERSLRNPRSVAEEEFKALQDKYDAFWYNQALKPFKQAQVVRLSK